VKSAFRRVFFLLLGASIIWWLATAISVYTFGQIDETEPADTAIVLGAAAYRDRPSPVFRERINHAIALYQAGTVDAIIFTGGVGWNDNLAESETAREYAIEAGVPEDAIYIETVSGDTFENLEQAQLIMQNQGFTSALIVSDPLHMQRAMIIAGDLGLEAYSSPTTTSRYESARAQLWFLFREVLFNMSYAVTGAG